MNNENYDDLTSLRAHLFEAIRAVKAGQIDLDKARAVNELGRTLVDTARVEVDYLRATGGGESAFLGAAIGAANLPPGITSVVRHRIKG